MWGQSSIFFYKKLLAPLASVLGFAICVLLPFLGACSSPVEPPSLDVPQAPISFDSCQRTKFTFKDLGPAEFRSVIQCLSGPKHVLQSYENLFDNIDDPSLSIILGTLSELFVKPHNGERVLQTLSLFRQLEADGSLDELIQSVRVLVASGLVKSTQSVFDFGSFPLHEFWLELMKQNQDARTFKALTRVFGGPRSLLLASLLTKEDPGTMNSDAWADFASGFWQRHREKDPLTALFGFFSDPRLAQSFKLLNRQEIIAIAKFLGLRDEQGTAARLAQVRNVLRVADVPLICLVNGKNHRRTENLLKFVIQEIGRQNLGDGVKNFILRDLNLFCSVAQEVCNVPLELQVNKGVILEAADLGFADAFHGVAKLLTNPGQFRKYTEIFKSDFLPNMAPILDDLAAHHSIALILQILSEDLSSEDYENLSRFARNLDRFSDQVAVALDRLSDENKRPQLRAFFRSLSKSLSGEDGGLGRLFHSLSQGIDVSGASPVRTALSEILANRQKGSTFWRALGVLTNQPHYDASLALTSELARSGQLKKFIRFFLEFTKEPGGAIPNLTGALARPKSVAASDALIVGIPRDRSLNQHHNCVQIQGPLFESSGRNLSLTFGCLSSHSPGGSLPQITNRLKEQGSLPPLATTLKAVALSPELPESINLVETLFNRGLIQSLLSIVQSMEQQPHFLISEVQGFLFHLLRQREFDKTLKNLGSALRREPIDPLLANLASTPSIFERFRANPQLRLKVYDLPELESFVLRSLPQATEQERREIIKAAVENYETHNESWRYIEGPYKALGAREWQASILKFFNGVLRPSALEEVVSALQDIGTRFDVADFLSKSSHRQSFTWHFSQGGRRDLHIQNRLDQIDALFLDSEFSIPTVRDMGIRFSRSVLGAAAPAQAHRPYRKLLEVGTEWSKRDFLKTVLGAGVHSGFKNLLENYSVVEEMAKTGHLEILARLYVALERATPGGYKNTDFPDRHLAGILRELDRLGFFANLSLGVVSLERQGLLRESVEGFFKFFRKMTHSDISLLRRLLERVRQTNSSTGENLLEKSVALAFHLPSQIENYSRLKESFFHLALGLMRMELSPHVILRVIEGLLEARGELWLQELVTTASNQQGIFILTGAFLLSVPPAEAKKLGDFLNKNPELLVRSLKLIWWDGGRGLHQLVDIFLKWRRDPRLHPTTQGNWAQDFERTLSGKSVFGPFLGRLLENDDTRRAFLEVLGTLVRNRDLPQLVKDLITEASSGNFHTLHFVFDNLSSSSLKF